MFQNKMLNISLRRGSKLDMRVAGWFSSSNMDYFGLNNAFILQGWRLHEEKEFLLWCVTAWNWRLLFSELLPFSRVLKLNRNWILSELQDFIFWSNPTFPLVFRSCDYFSDIWSTNWNWLENWISPPFNPHLWSLYTVVKTWNLQLFCISKQTMTLILSEIHCSRNFLNLVLIHLKLWVLFNPS